MVVRNTLILWADLDRDRRVGGSRPNQNDYVFRLDALALSVIATATWLRGWLGVRHSQYCIKTTKPIRKPLDHLVGTSFKHLGPLTAIPNSKGNPFIGGR